MFELLFFIISQIPKHHLRPAFSVCVHNQTSQSPFLLKMDIPRLNIQNHFNTITFRFNKQNAIRKVPRWRCSASLGS